jgi:hypothetical protein
MTLPQSSADDLDGSESRIARDVPPRPADPYLSALLDRIEHSWALQLFCSAILLLPYLICLFWNRYLPSGIDETRQLEAAVRIAGGYGYTIARLNPGDPSIPLHSYLVTWPPAYSLLIAAL